jgi:hypothetical protein
MDAATTRKLVRAITSDVPYLLDAEIHSVEQAVMAINALLSSVARSDTAQAGGESAKAVDKLYDAVQDRERFDRQRFIKYMAELGRVPLSREA